MAGINSILAGFFAPSNVASFSPSTPEKSLVADEAKSFSNRDVFESGQEWKNRSRTQYFQQEQGLAACRCGSCPACAVQAYQEQNRLVPVNAGIEPERDESGMTSVKAAESEVVLESEENVGNPEENDPAAPKGVDGEVLSRPERAEIAVLKQADSAVRAHEQAHLAAAGSLSMGGASFQYQVGPDGKRYAIAGEVSISTSKGATPEETLARMSQVRTAALAPADPSPQDRKVAAQASVAMTVARAELRMEKIIEQKEGRQEESMKADEASVEASSAEKESSIVPDSSSATVSVADRQQHFSHVLAAYAASGSVGFAPA